MLDSRKSQNVLNKIAVLFKKARESYNGPLGFQRQHGRLGISQRDLAKEVGLKHTQISDIENAKRNAGILSFFVVAEFLEIDLAQIIKIIKGEGKLIADEK